MMQSGAEKVSAHGKGQGTRRGVVWTLALALALAVGIGLSIAPPASAQSKPVLVFAAASLKNALDDVNAQYQRDTGKRAEISYAASSALARQVEAGAPADIFISADLDWMNYLQKKGLVRTETRKTLLGNELVLVGTESGPVSKVDIKPGFDLKGLLKGGKLAMADTAAVPAGKYGKTALEKLGVWNSVQGDIAQAENVRAALALVARGEAPLGIVYQTDAAAEPNVRIVGVFPEDSHPPVVYPAALLKDSKNPDAAGFLAYMESAKARPFFEKQGFTVLK